jgi:imidazolonepropionase-like amidohydrolase
MQSSHSLISRIACVLFLLLLAACQPSEANAVPTLALTNGTLIDGTGASPITDAVVLIQGEKVLAAGSSADVRIPTAAEVIDVQGATILPGFINAHVHDGFNPSNLSAWAQAGVTTVRDEGTRASGLKAQLDARRGELGKPEYARIVSAGAMMTVANGYGQLIVDDTPEAARQAAQNELDAGADLVKVSREDGYAGTTGLPKMSDAAIQAVVELAHQRGTKVSAHITQARFLEEMLPLGVDDIAHTPYDYLRDEAIAQMVQKGISLNTTFSVLKSYGAPLGTPVNNLRRFVEAGGMVVLGNDYAGGRDLSAFELGMPMFEIEKMSEAGMTPMQIIVASTYNAAQACNKLDEIGTLEAGKFADILIVRSDPLKDIHALTDVQMVIHLGVVIRDE